MDINEIATKKDLISLEEKINVLLKCIEELKTPQHDNKPETFYRQKEVLTLLKISDNTLRKLVAKNEIIRVEVTPGTYRFPIAQFDKYRFSTPK